jgi:hypothetical protein
MSKAQTDIRTTSYDARYAKPEGYQGTLDEVLAQIRTEPGRPKYAPSHVRKRMRHELLMFLGVTKQPPQPLGPSTADDQDVRYGAPEPVLPFIERLSRLTVQQTRIYVHALTNRGMSIERALLLAEYYPYPPPAQS